MVSAHSVLPLCGISSKGAELLGSPRGCFLVRLATVLLHLSWGGNSVAAIAISHTFLTYMMQLHRMGVLVLIFMTYGAQQSMCDVVIKYTINCASCLCAWALPIAILGAFHWEIGLAIMERLAAFGKVSTHFQSKRKVIALALCHWCTFSHFDIVFFCASTHSNYHTCKRRTCFLADV